MFKKLKPKKHQILVELCKIYDKRTYGNENYEEEGKSLSREELNIETGIKVNVLDNHLQALLSEDLIGVTKIIGKEDTLFYYLKSNGHNAISDKKYIWRTLDRFGILLALGLALFGVLNSIFSFFTSK